jgi:GT2 family glycosyltransferase
VQGFNPTFKGWGNEDLDFAWRLRQEGVPIHFFLDSWGEHQVHTRTERFHTLTAEETTANYVSHYVEATDYTPEVRCSEMGGWRLRSVVFKHYIPRGSITPTEEFCPELVYDHSL